MKSKGLTFLQTVLQKSRKEKSLVTHNPNSKDLKIHIDYKTYLETRMSKNLLMVIALFIMKMVEYNTKERA